MGSDSLAEPCLASISGFSAQLAVCVGQISVGFASDEGLTLLLGWLGGKHCTVKNEAFFWNFLFWWGQMKKSHLFAVEAGRWPFDLRCS